MNSPLKLFDKSEPTLLVPERKKAEVISIMPDSGYLIERLSRSKSSLYNNLRLSLILSRPIPEYSP